MIFRTIKTILFLICVIGLLLLPMSNIFFYNESMAISMKDFVRVVNEKADHTDFHSSDISTFVNDYFIFYVPPAINRQLEYTSAFGSGYRDYLYANLSTIQLFSYENGAKIEVEWLNCTAINGTEIYINNNNYKAWRVHNFAQIKWVNNLPGKKILKKSYKLGEYDTEEIHLANWTIYDKKERSEADNYRILCGVVKITSDYPISVMHHKLYEYGTIKEDGFDSYEYLNYNWDGVYSAYGKKIFTRIAGDCWISAFEANTEVHVWDNSDQNDEIELNLDRFEGWAYSRNAVFEQFGFDDDLVLISADKPISIVAGLQADQCFVQIFGKDGVDFKFPCFGYVLVHAPEGATIELDDKSGNQGSYEGPMEKGEMRVFDFKVAYKQKYYSSFEWAQLRSDKPVFVYTFVNSTWYLSSQSHYENGRITGEEYITNYKKTTEFYSHGLLPYPADTEFTIPIRSRAYVTIVNLENPNNEVKVNFQNLIKPYKSKLDKYQSVTLDYSKDSYYPMDLYNEDTDNYEEPSWLISDPDSRYFIDHIPRIAVHEDDVETLEMIDKVSWQNITKGLVVKIKSEHPILVFINYDNLNRFRYTRFNDDSNIYYYTTYPQGIDLIPGLSPPSFRGLPDAPALIVIMSGIIIAVDMIIVAFGKKSNAEIF